MYVALIIDQIAAREEKVIRSADRSLKIQKNQSESPKKCALGRPLVFSLSLANARVGRFYLDRHAYRPHLDML